MMFSYQSAYDSMADHRDSAGGTAMRIQLSDIEPQIGEKIAQRLCSPAADFLLDNIYWRGMFRARRREPTTDEEAAYRLRTQGQAGARIVLGLLTPLVAACPAAVAGASISPAVAVVSFAGVWGGGTAAGLWWAARATPFARLKDRISVEELRAVFPLLSLTRAERAYCDTLLLLAAMDVAKDTRASLRSTVGQLNNLLLQSRKLEDRRKSLLPVLGSNSVADLEKEYGDLGVRLDATVDAVARESLQQSLRMCSVRMENARAFEQGLVRLNAQQEAIVHTIASVHSALARMQIAPETETAVTAQDISHSVDDMTQQTYAVEQAVQEVMTLRSS